MGVQFIFVVETNKKCKSDWIYIKDTIDYFYEYERTQVKFSPVYMDGRGKYRKKEKEVKSLISQYKATSKSNQSRVIYCFDCDDYDTKQEDLEFLEIVKKYCDDNNYDFVWFCKDVEQVYIGKKVDDSKKNKEAAMFKAKKLIAKVDASKLLQNKYRINTSNLMNILDSYEELKRCR